MTADELLEGWATVALPDVFRLNPPKPKSADYTDDLPVTFVPMPAVNADSGTIRTPSVRKFSEVRKGFTSFGDGDVILAKITPCMENGKAAIVSGMLNGIGFGSTEFHVFRPTGAALAEYLFHFIRQESFRRAAADEMTGSVGQKRVPAEYLNCVELPLPPLAEQRRIVAAVERILGKVSAARARLERVPTTLKRFRQAVLSAACSGGPNWRAVTLADVIDGLKYGTSKKSEYETKGVPILRIPNVSGGQISHDDMKYSELEPAEYEQLRLRVGDVLMIRSNGSVSLLGKTALVSQAEADFAYAGYLIRIRPNATLVLPTYLNAVLASEAIRTRIEMPARSTSGVNNINSEEVRALEFALPPLAEQQEIVRRISALFARADAIEARASAALKRVESLTQAVLAKAFRGELVPTEAELARRENRPYESAGELLERIRASATAPAKPSRTRKRKGSSTA